MFIFFQEVCAEPEVICNDEEKCETMDEEVLVYKIPVLTYLFSKIQNPFFRYIYVFFLSFENLSGL